MKKLIILFFLISFYLYPVEIKFLWWNVQDFFDTYDDPMTDDTVLTNEQYNNKLQQISQEIKKINPDIVGLAEVENINVLKDISIKSDMPFYYLVEGNDPRGIDVCLLSKYKAEYITHKDQPTPYKENKNYKFSRDCPEAIININDKKIFILLNHLKSSYKNDETSLIKRNAQVKGILDIILSIYKKEQTEPFILLMGDFNSERFSEPMNILQKSGLEIINYLYKNNSFITYHDKVRESELDYFIFNKKLFNNAKIKNFKTIKDKDTDKISDHFPLYLVLDL